MPLHQSTVIKVSNTEATSNSKINPYIFIKLLMYTKSYAIIVFAFKAQCEVNSLYKEEKHDNKVNILCIYLGPQWFGTLAIPTMHLATLLHSTAKVFCS